MTDLGEVAAVGHSANNGSMPACPENTATTSGEAPVGLRFELYVDDVGASIRFYGATLGLIAPDSWDPAGYVPLRAGAVTIGVQRRANLPSGHYFSPSRLSGARGIGVEIVVEVNDVERAYAAAARSAVLHGGRIEALANRPWGARDFRLVDPDGYYVRVTSAR